MAVVEAPVAATAVVSLAPMAGRDRAALPRRHVSFSYEVLIVCMKATACIPGWYGGLTS
jgi:hypothetical protein